MLLLLARNMPTLQESGVDHVGGAHDLAALRDLVFAGDLSTPVGVVNIRTPARAHVAGAGSAGSGGCVFFGGCGSHTPKPPCFAASGGGGRSGPWGLAHQGAKVPGEGAAAPGEGVASGIPGSVDRSGQHGEGGKKNGEGGE